MKKYTVYISGNFTTALDIENIEDKRDAIDEAINTIMNDEDSYLDLEIVDTDAIEI